MQPCTQQSPVEIGHRVPRTRKHDLQSVLQDNRDLSSRLASDDPVATMTCGFSPPKMAQKFLVVAAGSFQSIGQDRQTIEGSVMVARLGQFDHGLRQTGTIDGQRSEGTTQDRAYWLP